MIDAEIKLALTELFLSSVDASVCAQKGLEWLGQHVTTGRALLATAGIDPGRLWGVAALGLSTAPTGEFVLDIDDRQDPLVVVAWSGEPAHFRHGSRQPETPLENASFYAVPIRPDHQLPPLGILLIESDEPDIDDDVLWFAEVLGEKLQALRLRNVTADPGLDRERHLLYSIINSVTDPILLTDESGKLIIGNLRAEQLFAIRAEEKNRLLISTARRSTRRRQATGRTRGDPRRSRRWLRPVVRAVDLAHVARARHPGNRVGAT